MRLSRLQVAVCIAVVCFCGFSAPGAPPQVMLYTESANGTTPLERELFSGLWTGAAGQGSASSAVTRFVVRASPIADELGALIQCDNGTLELRRYDSGVWFGGVTVAFDVGAPTLDVADAAFESKSGRVVMGYRKGSNTLVYISTHDGALSAESWVDLGLGSAPLRVGLFASPGSDEVIVVASDGATLAAGVWDGTTVGNVQILDPSYTPGDWAAIYETGSGRAMVAWARNGDTSFRTRVFSSGAWLTEGSGPVVGGSIGSIRLTADPGASANSIVAITGCNSGSPAQLYASDWNGANWSVAQQLSGSLSNTDSLAVAFEPEGAAAVATWQDEGRNDLYASRWDGSAWSAGAASGAFGDGVVQIEAVARDSGGAVLALARTSSLTASSTLLNYVIYSSDGHLDIDHHATVVGLTGAEIAGLDLPPTPTYSAGTVDIEVEEHEDLTLAPGVYRHFEVEKEATIRFSAGLYVFEKFDKKKDDTTMIFDTSGGDITFVLTDGSFRAKKRLKILRLGTGAVSIHLQKKDFKVDKEAVVEAAIYVYDGKIEFKDDSTVTGVLYAKKDVKIKKDSLVTYPTWQIPGGTYVVAQELHAFTITGGLPGSGTEITSAWDDAGAMPFAISHIPPTSGRVTVVKWREIDPDQ